MRVRFILSETWIGLRRNATMLVAAVITMTISLGLLALAWLIGAQSNAMKDFWFGKIEVSVFLTKDVTQAQREAIRQQLEDLPQVERVFYESQEEAYQRFKEQFKTSPALVENTSPDALPESFRVKLQDPRQYPVVASAIAGAPGVDNVTDLTQVLQPLFNLTKGLRIAAGVLAALGLVGAALLVYNAVRVAAYSRRREIGIMRLVGASNLYIRLPFLLEGAVAGLLGGILAAAGLIAFKSLILDGLVLSNISFIPPLAWTTVWGFLPLLFVVGMVLAVAASFVTLQRHLRV